MASKLDIRQSISHDTLDQINGTAGTQVDALLRDVNSELTMPFRMTANSPATRVTNVGAVSITNPDHARNRTISPLRLGIPTFTSGSVTLPAASGGNITNSTSGPNVVLTLAPAQFAKVGINIDASGNFQIAVGTSGASIAAAGQPPSISGTFAIGHIIASNVAGVIQNVTNSFIYQYMGGGGSGSGSGSGEKNYIGDPDSIGAGWVASGAGVTVSTDSTNAELPEESKRSGILITGVSGTDYARYRFTLDDADKSKKLKIYMNLKSFAGYTSDDFKIEMYTNTLADYTGSYVSIPVGSPNIPKNDSGQVYITSFDTNTLDYYELRITRVAGTSSIVLSGVLVGPGTLMQTAALSEWQSFTPAATNLTSSGTGAATFGRYRRVGDSMEGIIRWRNGSTGGGTAGVVTFTVPASLTIDSAKISLIGATGSQVVGDASWYDASGVSEETGAVVAYSSSALALLADNTGTYLDGSAQIGANQDDIFTLRFMVPISQWSGQGTVHVSQNNATYMNNSSSSTTGSDTTSFGYGQGGQLILNFSSANAAVVKRVRAQFAISASDNLQLKVSQDGVQWFDVESIFPYLQTTTAKYGARLVRVSASGTDIDVEFGGDGANGQEAWSIYNTWKWRVDHSVGGQVVGFQLADSLSSGLVSAAAQTIAGQKTFNSGITTLNAADQNVTIAAGSTLRHPLLTVGNGITYTANGTLIVDSALTVTGTGVVTINAESFIVDPQASNALATPSVAGLVGTGAQTFGGAKIFNELTTLGSVGSTVQHVINGSLSVVQGQIKFPVIAVPSSDANTLDDYEEGAFTPTVTSSGGGTVTTYDSRSGIYTKIGRVVHLSIVLQFTSAALSAGDISITGLPFTSAGDSSTYPINRYNINTNVYSVSGIHSSGSTSIDIYKLTAAGGTPFTNRLTVADLLAGSNQLILVFRYIV